MYIESCDIMPSLLTHLAVGKKANEKLCKKEEPFLTGCIAPDLAKLVGVSRNVSHFINSEGKYDYDGFINKYKDYINNDYVLGYYVHIYTDYLWYRYFTPSLYNYDYIIKKDGTQIPYVSDNMLRLYLYTDYSNKSFDLIKEYNLDLEFLYKNEYYANNIIEEIPYEKIGLLIDETVKILKQKKYDKNLLFDF